MQELRRSVVRVPQDMSNDTPTEEQKEIRVQRENSEDMMDDVSFSSADHLDRGPDNFVQGSIVETI